jgi:NAD(P)-dependent dehydrogenase (short-subunit alcohol dehydrogenase family)
MEWTGRVAVITGGASGIGAATAREFALEGASVAILDINAEGAEQMAAALRAEGASTHAVACDVSDQAACQAAVREVEERLGRVDFLVNNAASFLGAGLNATTEDWEKSLGVNVRGCANMTQACFEAMKRAGGGAVVNIASISGYIAQPNRWTYNAGKGAILSLTRCQALDLARYNIRVNSISPGWTWTPEVERAAADGGRERWEPIWGRFAILERIGEAREIARPILFLCSDDASFITGADLSVDGGYMALRAEGLGDRSEYAGNRE